MNLRSDVIKKRVYDVLFILAIVLSLFNGIDASKVPFIVYTFLANTTYAATYPLFLLSLLYFIDSIVSGKIGRYKGLLWFFCFYMVVKLIVSVHGSLSFEFFDYIKIDEISGISKIFFDQIKRVFPSCSDYTGWVVCYIVRNVFNSFVRFYSIWFVVYSVGLYCVDSLNLSKSISIGLHIAIGIVCFYEVFEIAHFLGFEWGTSFLTKVNPCLYSIATEYGWWPPLLPSGVRNVFQEQSYYAYWACLVLPFFLYNISRKKWYDLPFVVFLMWCMIASNSRTGIALLLGELFVIFVCELLFIRKKQIIPVLIVFLLLIVICVLALGFLSNKYKADNFKDRAVLYLENTIGTLTDKTARSNPSRFGIRDAEIATWKESPLFGVGIELEGFYFIRNIPEYAVSAVGDWVKKQELIGSSPCSFPALNQYTSSLASGGIFGFLADTMPVVLLAGCLFVRLLRKRFGKDADSIPNVPYSFIIGSLSVILAFGVSCNFYMMSMPFIVLGLAFAFLMKGSRHKEECGP